jgi:hypothetical protein
MVKADSGQLLSEFVVGVCETEAADPFYRWLHDGKSVRIDWSTFGIEKLQSA